MRVVRTSGSTATGALVGDDLRRRWRVVLVVGLLMGLTAGSGLAAIAGARRTQTSFPRHLEASRASQVEIDPGQLSEDSDEALRALPGVEDASWWAVENIFVLDGTGQIRQDAIGLLVTTSDGRYLDLDRVAIEEGRRVDPDAPDEVMINRSLAEEAGLEVGDHIPLGWASVDGNGQPTSLDPVNPIEAEIVGIMAPNEDVVATELDASAARIYASPSYRPPDPGLGPRWYGFAWYGLRLTDGDEGVNEVVQEWNDAADEHNATLDEGQDEERWLVYAHRTSDLEVTAARAVRPLATALTTVGLVLVLTASYLGGQALNRSARQERDRLRHLRQLGADRALLVRTGAAVPALTVTIAAAVALVTAWLLSTHFPVGPFTVVEPRPGRNLDLTVLGIGLFVLVVAPLAACLVTVGRIVRQVLLPIEVGHRSTRISGWLARTGAPEPLKAAVRLMAPGDGASFVPTPSVLASTVVVVVVVVGTIVFAENLRALGDRPERFGWSGDSLVMSDGGYGSFDEASAAEYLAGRDDVDGWRLIGGDRTAVNGRPVAGIDYGPGEGTAADYEPVLSDGRAPAGPDEVVLGRQTLEDADAAIGDTITVGTGESAREATVVGTAVFPVFGPVLALRTSLDVGIWVDPDAGVFTYIGTPNGPPFNGLLLDLEPGAEVVPDVQHQVDVFDVVEPTEVSTTIDATRYEPGVLGALALAGLLTILLMLVAVIRRRREVLGIYRVLGFTPHQLRTTICLQGLLFAVTAVVIGVPGGIVVGRVLWRRFADDLGVLDVTDISWNLVVVAAVAVLVVGVLSSVPPALVAGRRRVTRDERG